LKRKDLITDNADHVLHMLLTILASPGKNAIVYFHHIQKLHNILFNVGNAIEIDPELLQRVLDCLYVWINSGDITLDKLKDTLVIPKAFQSLENETTFDVAVDLICEILHQAGIEVRRSSRSSANDRVTTENRGLASPEWAGLVSLVCSHLQACIVAMGHVDPADEDMLRGCVFSFPFSSLAKFCFPFSLSGRKCL
jgi:hypothetical protein